MIRHYEGLLVTLTNVYFPGASVGGNFASGNLIMTNLSGGGFTFFLNAANVNIIGQPVPQFARTVTGPMGYFISTPTTANLSWGFELDPSAYSDIVAGPGGAGGVPRWKRRQQRRSPQVERAAFCSLLHLVGNQHFPALYKLVDADCHGPDFQHDQWHIQRYREYRSAGRLLPDQQPVNGIP